MQFDVAKDAINIAERNLSLAEFDRMVGLKAKFDAKHSTNTEKRYIVVGLLDGVLHAAVITFRAGDTRVISLRRASRKERRIYAEK